MGLVCLRVVIMIFVYLFVFFIFMEGFPSPAVYNNNSRPDVLGTFLILLRCQWSNHSIPFSFCLFILLSSSSNMAIFNHLISWHNEQIAMSRKKGAARDETKRSGREAALPLLKKRKKWIWSVYVCVCVSMSMLQCCTCIYAPASVCEHERRQGRPHECRLEKITTMGNLCHNKT